MFIERDTIMERITKTFASAVELASDDTFRAWINASQPTNSAWQQWLKEQPDRQSLVHDACVLVASLSVHPVIADEASRHDVWQRIQASLHASLQASKQASLQPASQRLRQGVIAAKHWYYWAAAASVVALIGFWAWQFSGKSNEAQFATGFGETRSLVLPDGSEVTLNANSELSYRWVDNGKRDNVDERDKRDEYNQAAAVREVNLKGEAFFHVAKQQLNGKPVKFIVHTADVNVEVLGTQFNVNTRRNRTLVVLNEGAVRLRSPENTAKPIELQPGEAIEVSSKQVMSVKKRVKTELYSAWKDRRFLFEDTSLGEIAQMLKENYDIDVQFDDAATANLLFTGNVPANNIDMLTTVIAESFRIQIARDGTTMTIKRPVEK
jgi:transmembrane sensor